MISYLVSIIFKITYLIIILTCLLSWIPIFDPNKKPVSIILTAYNKIMAPFRGKIPPIGRMDFTPMVVFILLVILEKLIYSILLPLGL